MGSIIGSFSHLRGIVEFIRLVETENKFSCFSWLVYGSGDYFNICSFDKSCTRSQNGGRPGSAITILRVPMACAILINL